jgi:hypothetical protein
MAGVGIVMYVLTGVPGLMTMIEAVARHRSLEMAVMQQVHITFTVLVLTGTAVVLAVQIWLWPLWRLAASCSRAISSRSWCNYAMTCSI